MSSWNRLRPSSAMRIKEESPSKLTFCSNRRGECRSWREEVLWRNTTSCRALMRAHSSAFSIRTCRAKTAERALVEYFKKMVHIPTNQYWPILKINWRIRWVQVRYRGASRFCRFKLTFGIKISWIYSKTLKVIKPIKIWAKERNVKIRPGTIKSRGWNSHLQTKMANHQ